MLTTTWANSNTSFALRSYCVRQNAYYLRRFSVSRVLWCPAGIYRGCQVISSFRPHRTWPRSQAALLWISKVWGYDPVCSRWSAKKTRKSQLESNKTYRTRFSYLWLLLVLLQLYFNAGIILVLIFGFYLLFTSLINDCYCIILSLFYCRIIHLVMRIWSNYLLTCAIEVINCYY